MQPWTLLIARICLSAIFIRSGFSKLFGPAAVIQLMASKGVPLPGLVLIPTIALELLGAFSILLGFKTRLGAIALLVFMIPTTLIFHTDFSQPMEVTQFFKNLAIIGGLLLLLGGDPGAFSLDARQSGVTWRRSRPISRVNR
jgi:putative oxidoreductase